MKKVLKISWLAQFNKKSHQNQRKMSRNSRKSHTKINEKRRRNKNHAQSYKISENTPQKHTSHRNTSLAIVGLPFSLFRSSFCPPSFHSLGFCPTGVRHLDQHLTSTMRFESFANVHREYFPIFVTSYCLGIHVQLTQGSVITSLFRLCKTSA